MVVVVSRALSLVATKVQLLLSSSSSHRRWCFEDRCSLYRRLSSIRFHSSISNSSSSSSLVRKLIEEPTSRIKATLDAANESLREPEASLDALITSLSSSSPQKAQLVLEWRLEKILEEKVKNSNCYSEIISMCAKIKNFQFAMQVFTSMEAQGIKPTSAIFNALIFACLSSGSGITALSLFEVMESSESYKPDSETYNTFILGFAKLGNDKTMQDWYLARKAAGFSPDLQTYEPLISGFLKTKNYAGIDRVYEEMMVSGVTPNTNILEKVLEGISERRDLVKAKEFLKSILDSAWELNENLVEKLVGLYSDLGEVEEMEVLLETLTKSDQVQEVTSRVHWGIIRMYATLDRLDDVENSVGRMLSQGIVFENPEDVDKVICSYFRLGAYDRLGLFLERIRNSHELRRTTYDLLVSGYRRAGLSGKLDTVINDMKLSGL